MEKSLESRIKEAKALMNDFGIEHKKLATYAERSHVTISRVMNANDERYATESNVKAIEDGIRMILDEYRKRLCGKTV